MDKEGNQVGSSYQVATIEHFDQCGNVSTLNGVRIY
jgi:hypothetical protein